MSTAGDATAGPSPLRQVLANRRLRRLNYALIGSVTGRYAFMIALGVYCFREGGAALVGLAGFLRVAPAALVAPLASVLVDRHRRDLVMVASDVGRALLMALAAVAVAVGAGPAVVITLITISALFTPLFEPARAALLPALVETPEQLTAANVVGSAVNSIGYFVAPALGGLLLVASSPQVVFGATALTLLASAGCVLTLHPPHQARAAVPDDAPAPGMLAEAREGLSVVRHDRGVSVLLVLLGMQVFVAGAVSVIVVVLALDTLDAGPAWVGYLEAAAGAGSLVGTVVVLRVVAQVRLSTTTAVGFALWGLPLLLIAAVDSRLAAVVALVAIGVGDTAVDVAAISLLQRVVPDALLGRVFGVLETAIVVGQALGALLTPLLIDAIGLDATLVVLALALPGMAVPSLAVLRSLDVRAQVAQGPRALLRNVSIFRPLPLPTVDALAMALRPVAVSSGEPVFRQGDSGDRYFLIEDGEAEVLEDGRAVNRLRPGDGFGEIALVRDVPRTATVVARSPLSLLTLERHEFLGAVTGHDASSRAADALASARLARSRAALAA